MQLLDRIKSFANDDAERVAYLTASSGATITYRALADAIHQPLVRPLRSVVLHAGNDGDTAVAFLRAIANGVDVLMMNDAATPAEVVALADRVDADAIVSRAIDPTLDGRVVQHLVPHASDRVGHDAIGSLLLATSGSTGEPKVVRRTAASLDAVARNMVEALGFTPDDRVLAAVPLTHSYGIEHGLLAPLWAGATVVLCDGLDLPNLAAAFACGITIFPAVPSMIERLAAVGEPVAGIDAVRRVYSAGGALPLATRDRFTERYGCPVGQLYGSTEVGTVLYRPTPGDEGDIGWPMQDVSVRVLSVDDRSKTLAPGELGEVAIRSPSMFASYVGDEPAELVDGHFLTGDLGRLTPSGSLRLEGRSRLLIDTGGLKVNPMEVEHVLAQHPAVASCVVVALRQSETVSRLRAVLVLQPDMHLTADAVRSFARARLAPYKVPRAVEFRSELPRSATGKVLRHIVEAS